MIRLTNTSFTVRVIATDIWKHISRGGFRPGFSASDWTSGLYDSSFSLLDLLTATGANVEWNKLRQILFRLPRPRPNKFTKFSCNFVIDSWNCSELPPLKIGYSWNFSWRMTAAWLTEILKKHFVYGNLVKWSECLYCHPFYFAVNQQFPDWPG